MANFLLSLATLITLLLTFLTVCNSFPTVSDSTGVTALFVFLTLPRWFAISGVLRILIARGEFRWISSCERVQTVAVFSTHALMGFAVLAANVMVQSGMVMEEFRQAVLAFTLLAPAMVLLYAGALANPSWVEVLPEDGMRKAACATAAVCAVYLVLLFVMSVHGNVSAASPDGSTIEFNGLPADAPLSAYLRFFNEQAGEATDRARQRVVSRPNLEGELVELLGNPEWSRQALGYIRAEMPSPSASLAPAAADAVRLLIEQLRTTDEGLTSGYRDQFDADCHLAMEIANRFPQRSELFAEPIRQMRQMAANKSGLGGIRQELSDWLLSHHQVLEARWVQQGR